MKRYQIISSWIFIGLGILHTAVGFITNKWISENVFWFFTGGMSLFYVGVINLIQTKSQADNFIGIITVVSNLVMTVFVISFGIYNLQKNLGDAPSWLLMVNSVVILFFSIINRVSNQKISEND